MLTLVAIFALLAILDVLVASAPPSSKRAHAVLVRCVENEARGCYFGQDGTRRADVQGKNFALVSVQEEPKVAVADYQFASKDGQFCAFVQFIKDQTWWTAAFYRCANKSKVHLGIG